MRKIACVVVLLLAFTIVGAQDMEGKIREAKAKYLTEKIELGADQKDAFWSLYDEYNQKRRDLRISMSQNKLGLRKSTMSDKEAKEIVSRELELKQSMLDLEVEYVKKYEAVLSIRQIISLYKAEDDFNKMMMQRLNRRNESGGPTRGNNQPNKNERPNPNK